LGVDFGASADFRDSALLHAVEPAKDDVVVALKFVRYLLKWSVIISLPVPLVWVIFSLANFIPWWQLRAVVIWGGIWLPLVLLSAGVDYARVHGGALGFEWPFKRKKKKKEDDEEDEELVYNQKDALDATIEANL